MNRKIYIFSRPDFDRRLRNLTVSFPYGLAGYTAGRESHPAPKTLLYFQLRLYYRVYSVSIRISTPYTQDADRHPPSFSVFHRTGQVQALPLHIRTLPHLQDHRPARRTCNRRHHLHRHRNHPAHHIPALQIRHHLGSHPKKTLRTPQRPPPLHLRPRSGSRTCHHRQQ